MLPPRDRPAALVKEADRKQNVQPGIYPDRSASPALFRDFLLEPGFYNYQDSSALLRLPPPRIDASDYDVVLINTPTRVAVERGADTKVICVVHDLLPLTDLKLSDAATRLFLSRLTTSLSQADELAFVSHYSMSRFRNCCRSLRMCRRGSSIRACASSRPTASEPSARPARPTFVVIVSAEPRKNLNTVIRAFRKVPQADLVVIGYTGGANLARNLPPNVRFSGYIEEQDKAALMAEAHGLIMPSFAEGFGVPIIEALAANTPVLCSDIPVFREVAGELADYFDPFSTQSISAAVTRVIARQEEWRERIRSCRADLAERFGHETQARDLLSHAAPAEYLVAAQ
jgi:glycosyltransferase involved in cell wall biosynthesis